MNDPLPSSIEELEHDTNEDGVFDASPITSEEKQTEEEKKEARVLKKKESTGYDPQEPWLNPDNPELWVGEHDTDD